MDKWKELQTTTDIVKDILEKCPEARNSDMKLYYRVAERINSNILTMPFGMVICDLKAYRLPAFESVRRTRQKLQSEYPELSGSHAVAGQRKLNEAVYRDYARGNKA